MTTVFPPRPRALALERAFVGRFYSVREVIFGTVSYETLLRSRGPIGPMTRERAQSAIILSGLAMGIVGRDKDGKYYRI